MGTEKWRDVVGFEGSYQVSDRGRVKRLAGTCMSKNGKPRTVPLHMLKPRNNRGYAWFHLCLKGIVSQRSAHSLVAAAFIGPRPIGWGINHKDGDRRNNSPRNLEYLTAADNNTHAYEVLGKASKLPRGERNHAAKLTSADVLAIRDMRARGLTLQAIATIFRVSFGAIGLICRRETWKHLIDR